MAVASTKLHLGCGLVAPQTWLNVDGSRNAWLAQRPLLRRVARTFGLVPKYADQVKWPTNVTIHDIRERLPWADGTFTAVYASHVLEHMYLEHAQRLLKESYRVLQPGGVVRMVVPDLRASVEDYLARRNVDGFTGKVAGLDAPGDILNRRLLFHDVAPARTANPLMKYNHIMNSFHNHKWMYDEENLALRLTEAGFKDVRRMGYGESRIDGILDVERRDRVEGGNLAVEGVKP